MFKQAFGISAGQEEENKKIKEAWENVERSKAAAKAQELTEDTRKKSQDSTSSEPQKNRGNRKSTRDARIKVIRLVPAEGEEVKPSSSERREVVLTPSPGYVEAEGREILSEREENGAAEIGKKDDEEKTASNDKDGPRIEGRYAIEAFESLQDLEEEDAKKHEATYEFLKWKIQKVRASRNKHKEVIKKPISTSSSSRHRGAEEEPLQEPPREERPEEEAEVLAEDGDEEEIKIPPESLEREYDEDKLPDFEDYDLNSLIEENWKDLQRENGSQVPVEGIDNRKVKLLLRSQLIFEIPLPVKDGKTVKGISKLLVTHVEDKMRYKIDRIHALTKGSKIVSSYGDLDRWYRESSIKRTAEEI